MRITTLILPFATLLLQVCLGVILVRKGLYRRFPVFTAYTVYAVATAIVRTALDVGGSKFVYFYVFWGTESLYAVLGLIAIYEGFREIFRPFYRIWWFRPLVYLLAVGTLVLSIYRAIHRPPVQADRMVVLILSFEIAVRYLQGIIFVLTFLLVKLFRLPARRYPVGILYGFGAAALGILAASMFRYEFGTKFNTFFSFAPPVAYLIACVIWLASFCGPEERNGNGAAKPPIPLEQMPALLRRYVEDTREISKGKWK
jgi:hypothetical protein